MCVPIVVLGNYNAAIPNKNLSNTALACVLPANVAVRLHYATLIRRPAMLNIDRIQE